MPPERPQFYKQYTSEQMEHAYKAYLKGDSSVRRIAEEYGIPKSTLQDRISGKVLPGSKSGKKRYLDDDEEKELVDFLIGCARIGLPRSRTDVIRLVQSICTQRRIDVSVFPWLVGEILLTTSKCNTTYSSQFISQKNARSFSGSY